MQQHTYRISPDNTNTLLSLYTPYWDEERRVRDSLHQCHTEDSSSNDEEAAAERFDTLLQIPPTKSVLIYRHRETDEYFLLTDHVFYMTIEFDEQWASIDQLLRHLIILYAKNTHAFDTRDYRTWLVAADSISDNQSLSSGIKKASVVCNNNQLQYTHCVMKGLFIDNDDGDRWIWSPIRKESVAVEEAEAVPLLERPGMENINFIESVELLCENEATGLATYKIGFNNHQILRYVLQRLQWSIVINETEGRVTVHQQEEESSLVSEVKKPTRRVSHTPVNEDFNASLYIEKQLVRYTRGDLTIKLDTTGIQSIAQGSGGFLWPGVMDDPLAPSVMKAATSTASTEERLREIFENRYNLFTYNCQRKLPLRVNKTFIDIQNLRGMRCFSVDPRKTPYELCRRRHAVITNTSSSATTLNIFDADSLREKQRQDQQQQQQKKKKAAPVKRKASESNNNNNNNGGGGSTYKKYDVRTTEAPKQSSLLNLFAPIPKKPRIDPHK